MTSYWKNETTYSKGEKDRTPRVWRRWDGILCMSVHRHIHYPETQWLLSCAPWFDNRELASLDVDDAKAEAEALVVQVLEGALRSLTTTAKE